MVRSGRGVGGLPLPARDAKGATAITGALSSQRLQACPCQIGLAWLGIHREICGRAPVPFGSLVASGGGRLRSTLRGGPSDNEKRGGKSMLPKRQG